MTAAPTLPLEAPAAASAGAWPAGAWRRELARAVTDLDELLDVLALSADRVDALRETGFALRVPRPYLARMRRGDPQDPLLRQVLPVVQESQSVSGYGADPLQESSAAVDSGLLSKYAGRVLLIAAGACAVNCRYCFRRHFPYAQHRQGSSYPALEAVRRDATIKEVILSGGDPLMLRDSQFAALVRRIAGIEHVRRLRIHTRLPVVIPQRVTKALIDVLASLPQQVVIVAHFNHGNELDDDCVRALAALDRFTLLNQSVLLRGVNDDADALVELSERLFAAGVLPYYLHMPDAVAGTAHFDVSEAQAKALHRRMAARLPGYLTPRLVRETPGRPAKEMLDSLSDLG